MTARELATRYIEDQIRIIEKYGGEVRLGPERRLEAIESTRRVFDTMNVASPGSRRNTVRLGLGKVRGQAESG